MGLPCNYFVPLLLRGGKKHQMWLCQSSDGEYRDLSWQCYNFVKMIATKGVIILPHQISQSTQVPFKNLGYYFFRELIWLFIGLGAHTADLPLILLMGFSNTPQFSRDKLDRYICKLIWFFVMTRLIWLLWLWGFEIQLCHHLSCQVMLFFLRISKIEPGQGKLYVWLPTVFIPRCLTQASDHHLSPCGLHPLLWRWVYALNPLP